MVDGKHLQTLHILQILESPQANERGEKPSANKIPVETVIPYLVIDQC